MCPRKEGGCAHFRQALIGAFRQRGLQTISMPLGLQTISMPLGFPAAHLSVRSPKLCLVEDRVLLSERQAVSVSSCTSNNLYLAKANICREDKAVMLHLELSSVGHSDKR